MQSQENAHVHKLRKTFRNYLFLSLYYKCSTTDIMKFVEFSQAQILLQIQTRQTERVYLEVSQGLYYLLKVSNCYSGFVSLLFLPNYTTEKQNP